MNHDVIHFIALAILSQRVSQWTRLISRVVNDHVPLSFCTYFFNKQIWNLLSFISKLLLYKEYFEPNLSDIEDTNERFCFFWKDMSVLLFFSCCSISLFLGQFLILRLPRMEYLEEKKVWVVYYLLHARGGVMCVPDRYINSKAELVSNLCFEANICLIL